MRRARGHSAGHRAKIACASAAIFRQDVHLNNAHPSRAPAAPAVARARGTSRVTTRRRAAVVPHPVLDEGNFSQQYSLYYFPGECSVITIECVLLLLNVFSHYRMCSLSTHCTTFRGSAQSSLWMLGVYYRKRTHSLCYYCTRLPL